MKGIPIIACRPILHYDIFYRTTTLRLQNQAISFPRRPSTFDTPLYLISLISIPQHTVITPQPFSVTPNHSLVSPMDDMLAAMWNSLSLVESKALALNIDKSKLTSPKFAIIGNLAMKKKVSTMDVEKFFKSL